MASSGSSHYFDAESLMLESSLWTEEGPSAGASGPLGDLLRRQHQDQPPVVRLAVSAPLLALRLSPPAPEAAGELLLELSVATCQAAASEDGRLLSCQLSIRSGGVWILDPEPPPLPAALLSLAGLPGGLLGPESAETGHLGPFPLLLGGEGLGPQRPLLSLSLSRAPLPPLEDEEDDSRPVGQSWTLRAEAGGLAAVVQPASLHRLVALADLIAEGECAIGFFSCWIRC